MGLRQTSIGLALFFFVLFLTSAVQADATTKANPKITGELVTFEYDPIFNYEKETENGRPSHSFRHIGPVTDPSIVPLYVSMYVVEIGTKSRVFYRADPKAYLDSVVSKLETGFKESGKFISKSSVEPVTTGNLKGVVQSVTVKPNLKLEQMRMVFDTMVVTKNNVVLRIGVNYMPRDKEKAYAMAAKTLDSLSLK